MRPGKSDLESNLARFARNGTHLGLFKIRSSLNVLKLVLKSPRFVPFGANLALFENQIDIPVYDHRVKDVLSSGLMKDRGQLARARENFAGPVDFETPRPDWPVHSFTFLPFNVLNRSNDSCIF